MFGFGGRKKAAPQFTLDGNEGLRFLGGGQRTIGFRTVATHRTDPIEITALPDIRKADQEHCKEHPNVINGKQGQSA